MPPKSSSTSAPPAELLTLFQSISLTLSKSNDAARSAKVSPQLERIIKTYRLDEKQLDNKQGGLVLHLATTVGGGKLGGGGDGGGGNENEKEGKIVQEMVGGRLKSIDQVNAAIDYLSTHDLPLKDEKEFEENCGIGITITSSQIFSSVQSYISSTFPSPSSSSSPSSSTGGWSTFSKTISALRSSPELRWADPLKVKESVEKVYTETWGEKGAGGGDKGKKGNNNSASGKEKEKGKGGEKGKAKDIAISDQQFLSTQSIVSNTPIFREGWLSHLHPVGGNEQIKPELMEEHLKRTGSTVRTRFPPEPNGFLHIGHSKAIMVNFGFARYHGGHCYLRYDDTNPEAEEEVYFKSIREIIGWLGFKPWKITYSSDNFQTLYELAVELIKRDKGYVCHCSADTIFRNRGSDDGSTPRIACSHRTRPISESLEEFEKMKRGEYEKGQAVLRMKQDLLGEGKNGGNPMMWDLVAYRVVKASHHRTGDTWKIYPTYDFTHCLCDSFEDITHSLCTTEFIQSRVSYEWLCDALEVYKPRQSEYGRLNLQGTVMSKRKILKLVKEGLVSGWDDPRLYTLIALRRRGVPPEAILRFVAELGVTTSAISIQTTRFEQTLRSHLEYLVPRLSLVLRPVPILITNLDEGFVLEVEKPVHPKDLERGTIKMNFSREVFIEMDDWRDEDKEGYFRLAPGKTVGLLNVPKPITCTGIEKDEKTGEIKRILCRYEHDWPSGKKLKSFIHWVANHPSDRSKSPIVVDETRLFKPLFKSDNPAAAEDFLKEINQDSLEVLKGSMVESSGFWEVVKRAKKGWEDKLGREREEQKQAGDDEVLSEEETSQNNSETFPLEEVRFQGLRSAYFCIDNKDSVIPVGKKGTTEKEKIVFNLIVSLKEDTGKGA